MTNLRTRREPEANYSSVFLDGKTLRMPIDSKKPITELKYPEFLDVSFGTFCEGKCQDCYASANPKGEHYSNVVQKVKDYFGKMTENERPFQVAIGGGQEPLAHPEFAEALKAFSELGIVPNYTTNGVLFDDKVVELTKKYCGGIAITCHPHLEQHWRKALALAIQNKLRINIHLMISDTQSIERGRKIFDEYKDQVDYFVLLPRMNVGYAAKNPKQIDYDTLEKWVDEIYKTNKVAFGANFFEFLKKAKKWDIAIYPPEIFSKYLVCDDNMSIYRNSFVANA